MLKTSLAARSILSAALEIAHLLRSEPVQLLEPRLKEL
jgi:hypothetical protein